VNGMEDLVTAVQQGDEVEAPALARAAIRAGAAATDIIAAMTIGMREVGEQFARMEVFLPEMTMAARAMQAVLKEVEPDLRAAGASAARKGTVVIGTVEGDMHTIGKDIVISLLRCHGFEIVDLGVNVNPLDFVRKAEEVRAMAIGASALMTTTMPGQKEIISLLKAKGLRQNYHVILGGAPVTAEWVQSSGADSWGENAWTAVEILERLVAERSR
jgi:corrinoid protein of di/trimethylamine methyltransferase